MKNIEPSILELPPIRAHSRLWYGEDLLQFGDFYRPEGLGPFPLIIIIHGGYWRNQYNLDHISHLCNAYAKAGLAAWSLEYRRIGDEGGAYPGTFKDIAAGIDYVRKLNQQPEIKHIIDLNKVIIVGHSAGGHLAVWAANRIHIAQHDLLYSAHPFAVKGVISLAGLLDLQYASELQLSNNAADLLLSHAPANALERYRFTSPINMLPSPIPTILFHGTKDQDVPVEISHRYINAAHSMGIQNVQVHLLKDTDHYDLIDPRSTAWELIQTSTFDLIDS